MTTVIPIATGLLFDGIGGTLEHFKSNNKIHTKFNFLIFPPYFQCDIAANVARLCDVFCVAQRSKKCAAGQAGIPAQRFTRCYAQFYLTFIFTNKPC